MIKRRKFPSGSYDNTLSFTKEITETREPINSNTRIVEDLNIWGDDLDDFLINYSKAFNVDMTSYLWYFHSADEAAFNPGSLFFKPPYKRVKRIPITIEMLDEFARLKKWNVSYLAHELPSWRVDILISWVILMAPILVV